MVGGGIVVGELSMQILVFAQKKRLIKRLLETFWKHFEAKFYKFNFFCINLIDKLIIMKIIKTTYNFLKTIYSTETHQSKNYSILVVPSGSTITALLVVWDSELDISNIIFNQF